jgi:hypothetical protein
MLSTMIERLPVILLALLVANAAALKFTIAGHTVDFVNPLTRQAGSSKPSLASALCPVTTAADIQLTPFPIKTDDVCGSFGLNIGSNAVACLAFGQMGAILANPPLRCAPDAVPVHPATDPKGKHTAHTTATTPLGAGSSSCRCATKKLQAQRSPCTVTHIGAMKGPGPTTQPCSVNGATNSTEVAVNTPNDPCSIDTDRAWPEECTPAPTCRRPHTPASAGPASAGSAAPDISCR